MLLLTPLEHNLVDHSLHKRCLGGVKRSIKNKAMTMTFLKILCRNNRPLGNTGRQKLGYFTTMKYFGFMLLTSVRQTNSALSNLSLNIQGHV